VDAGHRRDQAPRPAQQGQVRSNLLQGEHVGF
jgi:hypothetical protein